MPFQISTTCLCSYINDVYGAMRLFFIIIFFCFFLSAPVAFAAFWDNQLTKTQQEELSNHPVWLKLLHFDKEGNRSEILTDEFFLSPNGRNDPKSEIIATVEAYFEPWLEDADRHPRCRFPARYFWLSQQIPLPNYKLRTPQCKRLENWALFNNVKSISLLLVSGYTGNPASIFGHSLLKLNTGSYDDPAGLFDLSINYGALVPENEAILRYVVRGIMGGYQAGFSDKYFYTQDLVYSRTEFRDIWDYELFLSDFDRTLLVLHIWEVIGKKFKYFFLDKNCAFRIAELLEIVIEEPLLENAMVWYAPIETFHRLIEIDTARRKEGKQGLIKSVRFIPSSQRKLYHQFARLNNKEIKAVETIIKEGPSSMPEQLSLFEQERQLEILDTVLAYHKYRLVKEEPSPGIERREIKDKVLLARLRLPPLMEPLPEVPTLNSPADGNRPMLLSIGLGYESNEGTYMKLRWSLFSQELVGENSLEGDELVVLDAAVGIAGKNHEFFIDKLDFIRVRKLKTVSMAIDDENPWSWQLRIGTMLTEYKGQPENDGVFSFGAGRAWKLNDSISLYAITDAAAHTLRPHARLRPHVGIIAGKGSIKSWWYSGVETINYDGEFDIIWGGQIQYKLSRQLAVFLGFSNERTTKTSAEFRWYW